MPPRQIISYLIFSFFSNSFPPNQTGYECSMLSNFVLFEDIWMYALIAIYVVCFNKHKSSQTGVVLGLSVQDDMIHLRYQNNYFVETRQKKTWSTTYCCKRSPSYSISSITLSKTITNHMGPAWHTGLGL